jgi:hypothetical protein
MPEPDDTEVSMKVFNLSCELGHAFEGWFASSEDFDSQLGRGLVECPVCGAKSVRKMPTAPRLNLSSASSPDGAAHAQREGGAVTREQVQALWLRLARHIAANTEDVGARFAEEARRIHHNEAPSRGIRGVATPEQARELDDEGIEVVAFPMPAGINEPLQ